MAYSDKFDDPIELPNGRKFVTLKDAIDYLGKTIPKAEHQDRKVLIAAISLANAAEGNACSDSYATGAALKRAAARFNADRKDLRWGKRKLKRNK